MQAVLIEAFSESACSGNGASVVLLDQPRPDAWLQAVAGSLRQSETAFLLRQDGAWLLRWFTPSCEVPLCGHATLAALLALAHWHHLVPGESVRFLTRSGPLEARLDPDTTRRGSIDLPSGGLLPEAAPAALRALLQRRQLGEALGFWSSALGYSVVLLAPEAPLAALASIAAELDGALARGLVLMKVSRCIQRAPTPRRRWWRACRSTISCASSHRGWELPRIRSQARPMRWWRPGGRSGSAASASLDGNVPTVRGVVCEALSSGKIRLFGSGYLLWDGTLNTQSPAEPESPVSAGPHCSGDDRPTAIDPDPASSWRALRSSS